MAHHGGKAAANRHLGEGSVGVNDLAACSLCHIAQST